MVRSVDRIAAPARAATLALLAAGSLAGCSTTQQEAARLQLNSARIRASELRTVVRRSDPSVALDSTQLISGAGGSVIVVTLTNSTDQTISDMPISVGIRDRSGARTYVNGAANLPYFDTHIPAVAPLGTLRWMFTTARSLPARARVFALVGASRFDALARPQTLPAIDATQIRTRAASRTSSTISLVVHNDSGVPQYQLPVYAYVQRGRRYLAAGSLIIEHLTSDASMTLSLRLIGSARAARVRVETPPSIFQ